MLDIKDTTSFKQSFKKLSKQNPSIVPYVADAINLVRHNPYAGEMKKGDLKGIRCLDIRLKKQNYEFAYIVDLDDNDEPIIILLLLVGTRENFYKELKRLI